MAGHSIPTKNGRIFIDYPDAYGEAVVDGKLWRWDFHRYLGPTFLRKDGEPRQCQFPRSKKVWAAFEKWLKEYLEMAEKR